MLVDDRMEMAEMMIIRALQAGMDRNSREGMAEGINRGRGMATTEGSGTPPEGAAAAVARGARSAARPMQTSSEARLLRLMSSPTMAASWTTSKELQTPRHLVRSLYLYVYPT